MPVYHGNSKFLLGLVLKIATGRNADAGVCTALSVAAIFSNSRCVPHMAHSCFERSVNCCVLCVHLLLDGDVNSQLSTHFPLFFLTGSSVTLRIMRQVTHWSTRLNITRSRKEPSAFSYEEFSSFFTHF